MEAAVPDTLHFVLLVHRGVRQESRARAAADWYINALEAVDMEREFFQASSLRRTEIHHAYFLRIGPPERGIILEVRDSFSNQGHNNGNVLCCLSSLNVNNLRDHIMNANAPVGCAFTPTFQETVNQENGHFMYRIRDPFGFRWIITSSQLLPNDVFQWGNQDALAQEKKIHSVHLIYLIDFPRAVQASDWYETVFACVAIHGAFNITGVPGNLNLCQVRYLRLAQGNRRVILEIRDSIRPELVRADDHSFSSLYSTLPVLLHEQIIGYDEQGEALRAHQIRLNRSDEEGLFVSKIVDPFGFNWFIKQTNPNLLNQLDQL